MIHLVYLLTSPSGATYVGRTKRFERRMIEHAAWAKANSCKTKLAREIDKYNFSNFEKLILTNKLSAMNCSFYERFWIGVFNDTGQSLNEMLGSQGWGSEEVAKKISAAKKGKSGKKTGPISDEHRKKLSEAHKGYKMPIEQKQKISEALKGIQRTKKHCENLAKSQRGKLVSAETREKQRQAKLGKKLTDEHKEKLSKARIGKPHSVNEEARQRLIARNKSMLLTPEMREQMRIRALGRRLSDEAKDKCRQASLKYWAERKALGAKA